MRAGSLRLRPDHTRHGFDAANLVVIGGSEVGNGFKCPARQVYLLLNFVYHRMSFQKRRDCLAAAGFGDVGMTCKERVKPCHTVCGQSLRQHIVGSFLGHIRVVSSDLADDFDQMKGVSSCAQPVRVASVLALTISATTSA